MYVGVVCCAFALLLIAPAAGFAQTGSLITVQTDASRYTEGDPIIISGHVSTVIAGTPITLKVSTLDDRLVEIGQIEVARDGSYSHIIIAQGDQWTVGGQYQIIVSYGEEDEQVRFEYFPRSEQPETTENIEVDAGSSGTFDVRYTIRGGSVQGMHVNQENLALIITINAEDAGNLLMEMPRSAIDATEIDSGDVEFIVLIDGRMSPHQETDRGTDTRTIMIDFEANDSEIWVIGTWVIPEFGTLALAVLAATTAGVILATRRTRLWTCQQSCQQPVRMNDFG